MKRKAWLYLAEALTLALCAALCVSVLSLYLGGLAAREETGSAAAPLFTREGVGRQLLRIAPLFGLWVLSLPAAKHTGPGKERQAAQDPERTLLLLCPRVKVLPEEAKKERALRKRIGLLCGGAAVLSLVWPLCFLLDRSHFLSWDLEAVMARLMGNLVPFAALAFGFLCAGALLKEKSEKRELEAVLSAFRKDPLPRQAVPMETVRENRRTRLLRGCLYALAVLLAVLGVLNGGLNDVLIKAINICTECIGLG